jgi:predicted DCC family thiol-disulfide oxidoreductase YuxK
MSQPIVVFDGECALCNGFVAWLVRHDKHSRFLIAGSNGEVGRAAISAAGLAPEITASTIVLVRPDGALVRSDAVLAILAGLGWPWRAAGIARLVPRPWRTRVYDWRAQRRARVEATDPSCGVPPVELVTKWRAKLATLDNIPLSAKKNSPPSR